MKKYLAQTRYDISTIDPKKHHPGSSRLRLAMTQITYNILYTPTKFFLFFLISSIFSIPPPLSPTTTNNSPLRYSLTTSVHCFDSPIVYISHVLQRAEEIQSLHNSHHFMHFYYFYHFPPLSHHKSIHLQTFLTFMF